MTIVEIHPQEITGNWHRGYALDLHTTSSIPTGENMYGHMEYDTIRPAVAQLLYLLKYGNNQGAAADIIDTAVNFLRPRQHKFDIIVPVPASNQRTIQPVQLLANGIGAALGVPVSDCVTTTRPTTPLKGVTNPAVRAGLVAGLYTVDPAHTAGRNVLLFDDLFRSGTTMNAICDVLLGAGKAASVRALTITKTRSNQ